MKTNNTLNGKGYSSTLPIIPITTLRYNATKNEKQACGLLYVLTLYMKLNICYNNNMKHKLKYILKLHVAE